MSAECFVCDAEMVLRHDRFCFCSEECRQESMAQSQLRIASALEGILLCAAVATGIDPSQVGLEVPDGEG